MYIYIFYTINYTFTCLFILFIPLYGKDRQFVIPPYYSMFTTRYKMGPVITLQMETYDL